MTKQWFKSKTLWFNILTGVVFVASYFGYQPNDVLMHNLQAIVTSPLFITSVNFVLRLFTKKALTMEPTPTVTIDSLPQ